jgi:predicted GNAT family acetyltransferase
VATCGLIREQDGFGRFQHVTTHPDWRRRGLCTRADPRGVAHGFTQWRLATLVMAADPDDVAIGIYRSLGYRDIDTLWLLERTRRRTGRA